MNGSGASGNETSSSNTSAFEYIYCSSRVFGGDGFAPIFSTEKNFTDLAINLNAWIASLSDPSKTVFTGLKGNGFAPLYDFIQEVNFKNRLKYKELNTMFLEPRLEICLFTGDPALSQQVFLKRYPILLQLRTRHGDYVLLRPFKKNDEQYWSVPTTDYLDEFRNKATEIAAKARQIYDLDVYLNPNVMIWMTSKPKKVLFPQDRLFRFEENQVLGVCVADHYNPTVSFKSLDENFFVKCKHPNYYKPNSSSYHMTYLLYDNGQGEKLGYSIYDDDILDMYGIRAVYDHAPEVSLNLIELFKYTIIGL